VREALAEQEAARMATTSLNTTSVSGPKPHELGTSTNREKARARSRRAAHGRAAARSRARGHSPTAGGALIIGPRAAEPDTRRDQVYHGTAKLLLANGLNYRPTDPEVDIILTHATSVPVTPQDLALSKKNIRKCVRNYPLSRCSTTPATRARH
jgi:hypothetical protein